MNHDESQARIAHARATCARLVEDLRQAIFSGALQVPPSVIPLPGGVPPRRLAA